MLILVEIVITVFPISRDKQSAGIRQERADVCVKELWHIIYGSEVCRSRDASGFEPITARIRALPRLTWYTFAPASYFFVLSKAVKPCFSAAQTAKTTASRSILAASINCL